MVFRERPQKYDIELGRLIEGGIVWQLGEDLFFVLSLMIQES